MSEQRDSEARGDDPLTCSKCGGPTKENGRWHPDIGAVYGYELGLAERDPAPDTPEVAERPEKCPTCGGAPDDPGYDEINAGDQTGRDYCPDPFHTPEDTSRVEEDEPIDLTTPGVLEHALPRGAPVARTLDHDAVCGDRRVVRRDGGLDAAVGAQQAGTANRAGRGRSARD